ncbi:ORF6N domain-containing protein, partial [bacterium]|nr:ORF6N domain-containing protein [bacterium]
MAKKNEQTQDISLITEENLRDKIFTVRGVQVMLDSDLARIYGYSTKRFNEQVKNNVEKFDQSFRFQLTNTEYLNLRSKISTSNWGGARYLPFVFTEQGIYMLMTVLRGPLATQQSIILIKLFKQMKDILLAPVHTSSVSAYQLLSAQVQTNTMQIEQIQQTMLVKSDLISFTNSFNALPPKSELTVCAGQIIEAQIAYEQIYAQAHKSIFVIDNYVSLKTLAMLRHVGKNVSIIIFSDRLRHSLTDAEIATFKKEYPQLKISFRLTQNLIHDRYIVLDYRCETQRLYHCGGSSKDAGGRLTTIAPMVVDEFFWAAV